MGIYTTFTCDKCNTVVEKRSDLLDIKLTMDNEGRGFSFEKPTIDVAKAYICKVCADKLRKAHGLIDIVYDKTPDTSERLFNAVRDIFDELFQEKNNV